MGAAEVCTHGVPMSWPSTMQPVLVGAGVVKAPSVGLRSTRKGEGLCVELACEGRFQGGGGDFEPVRVFMKGGAAEQCRESKHEAAQLELRRHRFSPEDRKGRTAKIARVPAFAGFMPAPRAMGGAVRGRDLARVQGQIG